MDKKRPVDKIRESGGSVDIGTEADGAITDMFNLNGRLIIIKEKSIYELIQADEIDPSRENADLPRDIQRLIINLGSDSELVIPYSLKKSVGV